jgi:hypothetical protein
MVNSQDANIVCPKENCNHQLTKSQLFDRDADDFESFVAGMSCPDCGRDFHPEDGVLAYFNSIPAEEAAYHSLSIGGFCHQGTRKIKPGHTVEDPLITSFQINVSVGGEEAFSGSDETSLELGIPYIWDTDGRSFEDVVGESVELAFGPSLLAGDAIVADLNDVSEPDGPLELAFTTSIREEVNQDEISLGYHYDTFLADVQGVSWPELLREGVSAINDGRGRAPYPLFITAFDNMVLRQIYRTARAHGWPESRIDSFLQDMRWKDWVKEGLEEITGERLTTRNITLYQEFDQVRTRRNTEIVHLTYDDNLPSITPSEAIEDLQVVLKTMLEVYQMCLESRQEL